MERLIIPGLVFLLLELLLLAGAGLRRVWDPPVLRRPALAIWLSWNIRPWWFMWRGLCGWVVQRAVNVAAWVCDEHEGAQATATYPAGTTAGEQ